MKLLDGRTVEQEPKHGIASHAFEIIKILAENYQNKNDSFIVLVSKKSALIPFLKPEQILITQYSPYSLRGLFELEKIAWRLKPHLFYSPSFMVPLFSKTPFVITLHDLTHLFFKTGFHFFHEIYYRIFLPLAFLRPHRILTVSFFSKSQIKNFYKIKEDNIDVCYNGIDNNFAPYLEENKEEKEKDRSILEKYKITTPFFLSAGNTKKHKNLLILASILKKLQNTTTFKQASSLVILSEKNQELEDAFQSLPVTFLSSIPKADLISLYRLSRLFLFPSLYEGFGLPPAEAIATGTPALVHTHPCLQEVLKENAYYTDFKSPDSAATAIESILSSYPSLETLLSHSKNIKSLYSWKTTARQVALTIEKVTIS